MYVYINLNALHKPVRMHTNFKWKGTCSVCIMSTQSISIQCKHCGRENNRREYWLLFPSNENKHPNKSALFMFFGKRNSKQPYSFIFNSSKVWRPLRKILSKTLQVANHLTIYFYRITGFRAIYLKILYGVYIFANNVFRVINCQFRLAINKIQWLM